MKKSILIAMLSLQLVTVIAKADTTRISIKPVWPVNCLLRDYPNISQISQIERTEETAESVTFEFVVRHEKCKDFARYPYAINQELTRVFVGPAKIELAVVDETDLYVRATFNKIKVFKLNKAVSDQKIERKYSYSFMPYGFAPVRQRRFDEPFVWTHPLAGMQFMANVVLTREISGEITLKQE